jgi:hypothetical protein
MTNKNIEDKTKYEKENGKKLPEKLQAYCDICNEEREFVYAYVQSGCGLMKDIPMYDCISGCRGTKAYSTLMTKFNGRIID